MLKDVSTLKNFKSPPMKSKEQRTAFHKAVKQCFEGKLASEAEKEPGKDSQGEELGLSILVFWKDDPKGKKHLRYATATTLPYIHFTLHKTNRETHDSLQLISRILRVPHQALSVAGTKDKRGVTVQRVCMDVKRARWSGGLQAVWKRMKESGEKMDSGGRELVIGDIEWSNKELDLASGQGNRFCITLRDVKFDSQEQVSRNIEHLASTGFINYFGLQRFGTSTVPTHRMGHLLLQSKWREACALVLDPRTHEEPQDIAFARVLYSEGKIKEAWESMPSRAVAEKKVLESLKKDPGNWSSALAAIPKNLRTMYVHSYQSYVWNNVASERVRKYGVKPMVGDLVLESIGDAAEIEGEEVERKGKKELKMPPVRTLEEGDVDKHTIQDVILPMPGWAIEYPTGPTREVYKEIMSIDDLDMDNMRRPVREYSVPGSYRYLVQRPSNVSHRLIRYESPDEDLAQSDHDKLEGVPFDVRNVGDNWAVQLEFGLGNGTYATMLLREIMEGETETGSRGMRERTERMMERFKGSIVTLPSTDVAI
ncbi:tRNA pseudouridine synthase D [Atractiella rhizophila]|nr:tRNA pseudouridine synthase D [Atractiella rhizophila]